MIRYAPFGYESFLGQVRPHGLGQQDFMARVEVRNAETGAYIEGADVRVVFPGGSLAKKTDRGGNAAFSRSEFVNIMSPEVQKGDVRIHVEAPGFETQELPFIPDQITTFDLRRALAPAIPTWAWVVGGLAAAGLVGYVVTR